MDENEIFQITYVYHCTGECGEWFESDTELECVCGDNAHFVCEGCGGDVELVDILSAEEYAKLLCDGCDDFDICSSHKKPLDN